MRGRLPLGTSEVILRSRIRSNKARNAHDSETAEDRRPAEGVLRSLPARDRAWRNADLDRLRLEFRQRPFRASEAMNAV
jgi:hypothetical protein